MFLHIEPKSLRMIIRYLACIEVLPTLNLACLEVLPALGLTSSLIVSSLYIFPRTHDHMVDTCIQYTDNDIHRVNKNVQILFHICMNIASHSPPIERFKQYRVNAGPA